MIYNEDNPMPTEMIREINDRIRRFEYVSKHPMCRYIMTSMVNDSPFTGEIRSAISKLPDSYFNEDNDPHKEHDFGQVEVGGERWFFKMSYYDTDMEMFGYDNFVMTIMHASEY